MTIRVLLEGWRDQYERMRRSRARLNGRYESSLAYDDDFYHAIQDAWHLKDWIGEDAALDQGLRARIGSEVEKNTALRIIADLANCTKHLVLRKTIREGAALKGTSSTVNLGDGTLINRDFRVPVLSSIRTALSRGRVMVETDHAGCPQSIWTVRLLSLMAHRATSAACRRAPARSTRTPPTGAALAPRPHATGRRLRPGARSSWAGS
jgi:hypothetical protein